MKKRIWEIEDKVNGIKTEDLHVEIITNYFETFVNTYDGLELSKRKNAPLKSYSESLNKAKNEKLTLQILLEKFRIFIPGLSATGHYPRIKKTASKIEAVFHK